MRCCLAVLGPKQPQTLGLGAIISSSAIGEGASMSHPTRRLALTKSDLEACNSEAPSPTGQPTIGPKPNTRIAISSEPEQSPI